MSPEAKRGIQEILSLLRQLERPGPEMVPITPGTPVTFTLDKVNSRGKHQQRTLCITDNSLLNIDHRAHTVQNEKMVWEIEEVAVVADNTVMLRFTKDAADQLDSLESEVGTLVVDGSASGARSVGSKSTPEDKAKRHYVCASKDECTLVFSFLAHLMAEWSRGLLPKRSIVFPVRKENQAGKIQERAFKLTRYSLLNLDGPHIQKELDYSMFKAVHLDEKESQTVWFLLEGEDKERRNICYTVDEAADLNQTLNARIEALRARRLRMTGLEDEDEDEAAASSAKDAAKAKK